MSRTPRWKIFVRAFLGVFILFMVLSSLWNWAVGRQYWTPLEMFISAVFAVLFFGGIAWLITNIAMALVYGKDPGYRAYHRSGGDPYFDSLPPPLNRDSEITRITGLREPEYDSFVPPQSWLFQCPRCGARVQQQIDVCWRCQYGKDGDSSEYFRRWGNPVSQD